MTSWWSTTRREQDPAESIPYEYRSALELVVDEAVRKGTPHRQAHEQAQERFRLARERAQTRLSTQEAVKQTMSSSVVLSLIIAGLAACAALVAKMVADSLHLPLGGLPRLVHSQFGPGELLTFAAAGCAASLALCLATNKDQQAPVLLSGPARWLPVVTIEVLALYCIGGKDRSALTILTAVLFVVATTYMCAVYIQRANPITAVDRFGYAVDRVKAVNRHRQQLAHWNVPRTDPGRSRLYGSLIAAVAVLGSSAAGALVLAGIGVVIHPVHSPELCAWATLAATGAATLGGGAFAAALVPQMRNRWQAVDARCPADSALHLFYPTVLVAFPAALIVVMPWSAQVNGLIIPATLSGPITAILCAAGLVRASRLPLAPLWVKIAAWSMVWGPVWSELVKTQCAASAAGGDNLIDCCHTPPISTPMFRRRLDRPYFH